MNKKKILIADDERDISEILKFNLVSEYDLTIVYSAEEALELELEQFDLFILDVMMEEISGFQLADIIRHEKNLNTPIIFLTAKNTENDLLTGFSIGGDDYIKKPFSINEVKARVYSVLKRSNKKQLLINKDDVFIYKDLEVSEKSKEVKINQEVLNLTKKELEILNLLIKNKDEIFSREDIFKHVWDSESFVGDRTIDVHITRLRKKLGDYGKCIVNRVGYGYKFETK
ncbi:MAG: response regulator transcription factor [Bacteroidota bacterium]